MVLLNYDHPEISAVGGRWTTIIPREAPAGYEVPFASRGNAPDRSERLRIGGAFGPDFAGPLGGPCRLERAAAVAVVGGAGTFA